MLARSITHALVGLEPRRVEVEAHIEGGVPGFAIVGLADRACAEAKHRVRSGIGSAQLEWPLKRITVNLAPAGLRKEGSGFDLSIALAVLAASRQIPADRLAEHAAVGELALDGRVRPVRGAFAVAEGARRTGLERILCAPESACEAELGGVEAVPVRHLAEAVGYLRGELRPPPAEPPDEAAEPDPPDLADVRGQERARRALELAAAGGHNLLLAGPPGTGKTMLGRRLPSILPPLEPREALEVMRIHSVAGVLSPERPLITRRPFRAPHHSASTAAIVGGGSGPRPGEASLAHRGVLLLDELPEFQRPALEALRQPLEDGVVSVARVQGLALFPARFQLVATMNLCPCAGRGDPAAECSCSPQRLAAFRDKLSRALLDRFDLVVTVPRPRAEELAAGPSESSAPVRERVATGRCPAGRRAAATDGGGRRAPRESGRTAAALRARPRTGCSRGPDRRGARGLRGSAPRARGRGARVPLADRAGGMNELALASFAAASDAHLVGEPRSARFAAFKASFDSQAELARLGVLGYRFLARSDPSFPVLLGAIHDPPPGLFLRGDADAELVSRPAVAIVGARACSAYGRQIARSLGRDLAAAGLVVVSGLARGIDGEAHRGALEASGATIAVLGCGIDRDYPAAHRELARQVAATGLVVSEYAPGVEPAPWRFPGAEPDRRGSLRGDHRRRSARAQRRADHCGLRARGGPRGVRGAG